MRDPSIMMEHVDGERVPGPIGFSGGFSSRAPVWQRFQDIGNEININ